MWSQWNSYPDGIAAHPTGQALLNSFASTGQDAFHGIKVWKLLDEQRIVTGAFTQVEW